MFACLSVNNEQYTKIRTYVQIYKNLDNMEQFKAN